MFSHLKGTEKSASGFLTEVVKVVQEFISNYRTEKIIIIIWEKF